MQYNPKLKKAAIEIKAILKKHDIAGIVVLHTPGFGEYLFNIGPSYSIASLDGPRLRVKTNPHWSVEKKKQAVTDTLNMFQIMAEVGAPLIMATIDMQKQIGQQVDILPTPPGKHSSEEEQNN